MKHYIALGGIGSRTLKAFAEKNGAAGKYYYLDSDVYAGAASGLGDGDRLHIVEGPATGTGMYRQIGKNAVRYEIFNSKLAGFFADIAADENAEAVIVTTSFGGFGGAAAGEIAEYVEALMWKNNGRSREKRCRIIAFTHDGITAGWPAFLGDKFAMNTMSVVNELAGHAETRGVQDKLLPSENVFNPHYGFCLIDTAGMTAGNLWKVLEMNDEQLHEMDVSHKYMAEISPHTEAEKAPRVFVSYSSKDQAVADKLVDALEKKGIGSWIATRSIREGSYAAQIIRGIKGAEIFVVLISKNSIASEQVKNEIDRAFARLREGMRIIPFILDDSPLDDECAYYLCRQEFFFGNRPPLDMRINELAQIIKDMLG